MNLTASLLALASHNVSSSLQDNPSYLYCHQFYGNFPPKNRDCFRAATLLEKGADEISYAVHTGIGPHALPLSKTYGTCMVQVDVAGPRLPQTYDSSPDSIRQRAFRVLDRCITAEKVGGFATSGLEGMQTWLTAEGIRLNRPFPTSTAFLTVTVGSVVPNWLSPGDYDPIVPHQLADVVGAAAEGELDRRKRVDLRWRELKLEQRIPKMSPRGSRVAWWDFSELGEEELNGTSLDAGGGMVRIELPDPPASSANSATAKRRRRRRTTT